MHVMIYSILALELLLIVSIGFRVLLWVIGMCFPLHRHVNDKLMTKNDKPPVSNRGPIEYAVFLEFKFLAFKTRGMDTGQNRIQIELRN